MIFIIKWYTREIREQLHLRFVQIHIGKLLGFGQNVHEIIP